MSAAQVFRLMNKGYIATTVSRFTSPTAMAIIMREAANLLRYMLRAAIPDAVGCKYSFKLNYQLTWRKRPHLRISAIVLLQAATTRSVARSLPLVCNRSCTVYVSSWLAVDTKMVAVKLTYA